MPTWPYSAFQTAPTLESVQYSMFIVADRVATGLFAQSSIVPLLAQQACASPLLKSVVMLIVNFKAVPEEGAELDAPGGGVGVPSVDQGRHDLASDRITADHVLNCGACGRRNLRVPVRLHEERKGLS